ncbi:MAG: phosphatase [Ruminococcaceae bacterium]|nr:phosphatase [Oscillospiraceae bacterium]
MKILTDIHTHTMASAHAYSTLTENVNAARGKGLELIAMTNHCPNMQEAPHLWHFENMKAIPRVINGVKVLRGAELNILSQAGDVDLDENHLKRLDVAIASIHPSLFDGKKEDDQTKTWLNVMENPYVDILGHTGRNGFKFDHEAVVKKAVEKNVCIEVNCLTIKNSEYRQECKKIILCCKKHRAKITVSSDSHFWNTIGDFDDAISFLSELDFPEELIVNRNAQTIIDYLKNKKSHIKFDS